MTDGARPLEFEDLTERIIGCSFRVSNKMGFGFHESVYERCLMIELAKQKLEAQSQFPIEVQYEGENVGDYLADILVEDTVIVELKSVRKLVAAHEVQLVNYLVATGKPIGLLLNFGEKEVEVRRKKRIL